MLAEHRERLRPFEASVFSLPMETLIVGCSGSSLVLFASSSMTASSDEFEQSNNETMKKRNH